MAIIEGLPQSSRRLLDPKSSLLPLTLLFASCAGPIIPLPTPTQDRPVDTSASTDIPVPEPTPTLPMPEGISLVEQSVLKAIDQNIEEYAERAGMEFKGNFELSSGMLLRFYTDKGKDLAVDTAEFERQVTSRFEFLDDPQLNSENVLVQAYRKARDMYQNKQLKGYVISILLSQTLPTCVPNDESTNEILLKLPYQFSTEEDAKRNCKAFAATVSYTQQLQAHRGRIILTPFSLDGQTLEQPTWEDVPINRGWTFSIGHEFGHAFLTIGKVQLQTTTPQDEHDLITPLDQKYGASLLEAPYVFYDTQGNPLFDQPEPPATPIPRLEHSPTPLQNTPSKTDQLWHNTYQGEQKLREMLYINMKSWVEQHGGNFINEYRWNDNRLFRLYKLPEAVRNTYYLEIFNLNQSEGDADSTKPDVEQPFGILLQTLPDFRSLAEDQKDWNPQSIDDDTWTITVPIDNAKVNLTITRDSNNGEVHYDHYSLSENQAGAKAIEVTEAPYVRDGAQLLRIPDLHGIRMTRDGVIFAKGNNIGFKQGENDQYFAIDHLPDRITSALVIPNKGVLIANTSEGSQTLFQGNLPEWNSIEKNTLFDPDNPIFYAILPDGQTKVSYTPISKQDIEILRKYTEAPTVSQRYLRFSTLLYTDSNGNVSWKPYVAGVHFENETPQDDIYLPIRFL